MLGCAQCIAFIVLNQYILSLSLKVAVKWPTESTTTVLEDTIYWLQSPDTTGWQEM